MNSLDDDHDTILGTGILKYTRLIHATKSRREGRGEERACSKMVGLNPTLWVISLNVSGINISVERQRLSDPIITDTVLLQ